MNQIEWLEPEEWEMCKVHMDQETFEEFRMFVKVEEPFSVGLPYPIITIVDVCEDFQKWGRYSTEDFRDVYHKYKNADCYKELYRLLAFTIYGYGNWSNNDRRHKGLHPIRFIK
jgi:hypothetical protein